MTTTVVAGSKLAGTAAKMSDAVEARKRTLPPALSLSSLSLSFALAVSPSFAVVAAETPLSAAFVRAYVMLSLLMSMPILAVKS